MKTKNKKILTRLSAVLATCLLLVALVVPCFADGVVSEEEYCVKTITFTDRASLWAFMSQNYTDVVKVVGSMVGIGDVVYNTISPGFDLSDGSLISVHFNNLTVTSDLSGDYFELQAITVTLTDQAIFVAGDASVFTYDNTNGDIYYDASPETELPDEYWPMAGLTITVYYYDEFTPTVAPIDPDAPTRTGLYGELYHIIRDAIYGENAFLDSTQEFTLTQIATWMTYIVILLPLVVIAIILFKIFVR